MRVGERSTIGGISSCSSRSDGIATQIRPRPCVAMKFTACGVIFAAAMTRSPSFSRSGSSTTTTMPPAASAATASATVHSSPARVVCAGEAMADSVGRARRLGAVLTGAADHNGPLRRRRDTVAAMRIEISLATVPPSVTLHEPDDFRAFSVVVPEVEHAWVDPAQVIALAAAGGAGAEWRGSFDGMVEYARSRGWVRDDGAIRAHLERT